MAKTKRSKVAKTKPGKSKSAKSKSAPKPSAAKSKPAKSKSAAKSAKSKSAAKPSAAKSRDLDTEGVSDAGDDSDFDIDEALNIDNLIARGRDLEAQREARAAEQAAKPQPVREPVAIRPAAPFDFAYSWWFDDAIPQPRRDELVAMFSTFTKVVDDNSFVVVAPDTVPERRRAAWDANGTIVELEQLDPQLPPREQSERLAYLRRALENKQRWYDVVMLLSSWDPATVEEAIATTERVIASWPDELLYLPDVWKDRPELRRLVRLAWGTAEETLRRPDLENVRMWKTQDVDGLRANADRFAHLTGLELSGVTDLGEAILELGALANLEHLALQHPTYSSGTGTVPLRAMLAAPHLQKLRALSLYGYTLTADDLDALADCDQPLRYVRLQYGGMKPALAKQLARLASRKRIERLDLKYNDLGPKGAATLFANGGDWASLEFLDFSANEIGPKGVAALCGADVRSLRWLSLSSNAQTEQLDAKAAQTIADTTALGKLESLNVYGHDVGAGVAALAESPNLRSLRALCTAFPGCSHQEIFAAATGSADGPRIEELHIGNPHTASKKRADWSRGRFLANVRVLEASSIGGKEYEALFECPHFGALEILTLGGCYSDVDKAFAALVAATPPPNLRYLDLSGWKFTPEQAAELAASPIGRQLWGLQLMASYTTPEAWRAFYEAGLPLTSNAVFTNDPASDHRTLTTFREEM